jgi:dihydrofolate reductase
MIRSDRTVAWEKLLGEPIAAVATARIIDSSAFRGTVVLTDTRLVVLGRATWNRPPKTAESLGKRLRILFNRSNLTDIEPARRWPGGYEIRYYEGVDSGEERRFRMKPGSDGDVLLARLECDLAGTG